MSGLTFPSQFFNHYFISCHCDVAAVVVHSLCYLNFKREKCVILWCDASEIEIWNSSDVLGRLNMRSMLFVLFFLMWDDFNYRSIARDHLARICCYTTELKMMLKSWKTTKKLLSCSNSTPTLVYFIPHESDIFAHLFYHLLLLPTRHENLSSYVANFQPLFRYYFVLSCVSCVREIFFSSKFIVASSTPPHTTIRFIARRLLTGRFTLL